MKNAISRAARFALLILLLVPAALYGDDGFAERRGRRPTRFLQPVSRIDSALIPECSGIVKSTLYDDLYWVHSDSGHPPRIFPIRSDGSLISSGILLTDGTNIDWEDITADDRGNLIIADTGNNRYNRDDLTLLIFPEPNPSTDTYVTDIRSIHIRYPKQGRRRIGSYDSEALFWLRGSLFLATKQLFGTTRLYQVPYPDTEAGQELLYLGTYDTDGMVTAADGDETRNLAAFLTYSGISIFSPDVGTEEGEEEGKKEETARPYRRFRKTDYLPISAGQCEALCFADDALLIINEDGNLFTVPLPELE